MITTSLVQARFLCDGEIDGHLSHCFKFVELFPSMWLAQLVSSEVCTYWYYRYRSLLRLVRLLRQSIPLQ